AQCPNSYGRAATSMATESLAGTVTVAMPCRSTTTVMPVQLSCETPPWMTSQYLPRGRPVAKVCVWAVVSLLMLIQARLPRLNESRLTPSSYQLATGALPAVLCQPTRLATPVIRSVHSQPAPQVVSVTKPSGVAGGESSP